MNSGYPLVMTKHSELERSTMLLMGKSTISMVIFNSYVKLPEGNSGLIVVNSGCIMVVNNG